MSHTITPAPAETYIVHVEFNHAFFYPVLGYEHDVRDGDLPIKYRCVDGVRTAQSVFCVEEIPVRYVGLMQASGRVFFDGILFDDLEAFVTYAQKELRKGLQRQAIFRENEYLP